MPRLMSLTRSAPHVRRVLIATLILGALGCASDGPPELTKKQRLGIYFENAIRYNDLGDYDRAQVQAEKALELDPDNERFTLIYARTNVMRGTNESTQEGLRVLQAQPDIEDYRWQMTFGLALERKGVFYDEAATGVRDGSRPTKADDRGARAEELAAEARDLWRSARERYQRAIGLRSGESEALNGLVRTCALLGDFEKSLLWADELIASIHDSQDLVRIQLDAPNITVKEEASLREAAEGNGQLEVKARLLSARIYRDLGRKREAVAQLNAITALQPDLAAAYSLKGQLLVDLQDYVKARAALQEFLDLTQLSFEHPDVSRAFDLQDRCERSLAAQR